MFFESWETKFGILVQGNVKKLSVGLFIFRFLVRNLRSKLPKH